MKHAAEQQSVLAELNPAWMYQNGLGTARQHRSNGIAGRPNTATTPQRYLGEAQGGAGVPMDLDQALHWGFCEHGNERALTHSVRRSARLCADGHAGGRLGTAARGANVTAQLNLGFTHTMGASTATVQAVQCGKAADWAIPARSII